MKSFSPWQFTLFRILFGCYLAIHLLQLIPHAGELFGATGLIGDPALNPTHGLFTNPLDLPLPDSALSGTLVAGCVLALLFAAGIQRHLAAFLLWFLWTALFHRNNLIANPSLGYVGLLLVLTLLIPRGEPWSLPMPRRPWSMPRWVFRTAWILMAAGYTFSGFTKLSSPSWLDGSALTHLLANPLARPGLPRDILLAVPDAARAALTWSVLAAELLFAPLALSSRIRPWIWLSMAAMHLGILIVVDFADLSLGMMMLHFFTFDPDWVPPKRLKKPAILAFDGECLMCNRSIRLLAEEDRGDQLRFTPLQGPLGSSIRSQFGTERECPDSMLISTGTAVLGKSAAVLATLDLLGGHWRVISAAARLTPRPLRDAAYDFIARHRHRIKVGKRSCELPSEALAKRILGP